VGIAGDARFTAGAPPFDLVDAVTGIHFRLKQVGDDSVAPVIHAALRPGLGHLPEFGCGGGIPAKERLHKGVNLHFRLVKVGVLKKEIAELRIAASQQRQTNCANENAQE